MANLRIVSVQIVSSTSIKINFTDRLTPNLVTGNVSIIADTLNIPDSKVIDISISGDELTVTCLPLTNLGAYYIVFKSINNYPFTSLNGQSILLEDNVSNKYFFIGPVESENPIKNYLNSFLKENIYNIGDDTTLVSKYIRSLSYTLSKALYDIRQVKNENYISLDIVDERKIRGEGPFDRLSEESAYEIVRVARTPTGTAASQKINFTNTPSYPISLQKQNFQEDLFLSSVDEIGKFNINDLILNLSNSPVIKVNSIIFFINSTNPIYTYQIDKLGYQILDPKYDQDVASKYLTLQNNQIKLNNEILNDPLFDLVNIIKVTVNYDYKNLGIVVDNESVVATTIYESIREVLPPIINVFNLNHAPIVDNKGNILTTSGLIFYNPDNPLNIGVHPAFLNEIPFRLNALPSIPGQYSVDYSTGTVYVYGADLSNDGTGPTPPFVTYKYKFSFKEEQDYAYDELSYDIVSLPIGNMRDNESTISFNYEQVLIPNIDYVTNLHQEILNERIENRIIALNTIKVKQFPITNVFKVYNETSGEIYTVDRWNNDKIYFRYFNSPNISGAVREKISFRTISNEMLFVDSVLTNNSSLRIFKILLNNNRITSSTEDSIGAFFNTSLNFSKLNIFSMEKWFNRNLEVQNNLDNLNAIGQYCVDYDNGIIYCAVSSTQNNNIGTATYKNSQINLIYPHIVSVDDLYYQLDTSGIKNKNMDFTSFEESFVIPTNLDYSDESYLNNNTLSPYQVLNSNIGSFVDFVFVPGVTNQVKFVRNLFEYEDLTNNTNPLNFGNYTISNNFNINVNPIIKSYYQSINFDGTNYYILINENIPYLSSNINYNFSLIRTSDYSQLWDGNGVVVPGNPVKLILSGVNSPNIGDIVQVTCTFTITNLSRIVLDYNKGDFLIDYTYLADEIIVSYEYGDNVLDFRTSTELSFNEEYYVSYKVGALRDSLLKNFGSLINITELTNFNLNFDRERYRDAVSAAMSSFIQGPTIPAIKNIGKTISHIEPELIESIFQGWSLGSSLLNPQEIKTTGSFKLLPAKFSDGVLIDSRDQTISFPTTSNLRLEEGTFESWIIPQWNGLDNDANLTFNILKDGYVIDPTCVFIGASEYHPDINLNNFSINKNSSVTGTPNFNKDGVFIYYDKDISGSFNRWYVRIIDGYVSSSASNYKVKITSNGSFYDSKTLQIPQPSNLIIFTGINSINFTIMGGGQIDEGITFISDLDHYLLDFGKEHNSNRLSIYKDISGYFNFRVYDRNRNVYLISADVSAWKVGDPHHIAASWKLNNVDNRDEMHLFIDGLEVPNLIKFGQKLKPYLHEKFRTVDSEEIIVVSNKDIIASTDLQTIVNTTLVTSSINFSQYDIDVGDTIFIDEIGFNPLGYTIVFINGQSLTLNENMPLSLSNGRFSINRTKVPVQSDIDIASNIAVSTISPFILNTDLITVAGSNIVSSLSSNFDNLGVLPGYLLRINDPSLNIIYNIVAVSGNTLTLTDPISLSLIGVSFQIYSTQENEIPGQRAIQPSYSISKDSNFNNILTISNNVFANDLVLIRTLGLNYQKVKQKYYVWSDNVENVIMTRLPTPIALDEVKITKIILPSIAIGASNSILSGGIYYYNNFSTSQPSNYQIGRTISVNISGNNVDFSFPVQVTINGVSGITTISQTVTFTDYGTLDFASTFISINYIAVAAKPINISKPAVVVECKEKYSITKSEYSALVPLIKYSYLINNGDTLYSSGIGQVRDDNNLFNGSEINNFLIINSPPSVAGYYLITGVSEDRKSLTIQPTNTSFPLPLNNFNNGLYQIFNTTQYRSGLQNGVFTFEPSVLPSQPYFLSHGFYEFEYSTYTVIKLNPIDSSTFIGSDFKGNYQINSIIDQVKIYSVMLTDTRVGENISYNQRSITKDFNSLKALKKDSNTLCLINFDTFPFTNDVEYYTNTSKVDKLFQSATVVNENFNNSLVLLDKPLVIENDGILNTRNQGTIEFWMSPLFDTDNDPNDRFYFDAFGAVLEEAVSINSSAVKISAPASKILNVRLKNGNPRIDYFSGGKLEIDSTNAIQEESISISNTSVKVSKNILQVIKVEIVGDVSKQDYFQDGIIGTDRKTIYLGKLLPNINLSLIVTYQTTENKNTKLNSQIIRLNKQLPYQNSEVIVQYIPQGLRGDRLAIYKDRFGYMNFSIDANGGKYLIREPIKWARNTWHRVKASYKFNGNFGDDEIRLFLDGYQYSKISIVEPSNPLMMPTVLPSAIDGYELRPNIIFNDFINNLFIGTQYNGQSGIHALIDNFRISNISRPIYSPYGYPIDVNYNSNTDIVFPVTPDLYTTYLLDFDKLIKLNTDFATIQNRNTGSFDFSVNILDSFGIVNSSVRVQEALEKLIKVLKPANSKVFIKYSK